MLEGGFDHGPPAPDDDGEPMTAQYYWPRGSRSADGWETVVDGAIEGWSHTGLRIGQLDGGSLVLPANGLERIVVPLAGSFSVSATPGGDPDDEGTDEFVLAGRASVFDGPTDVAYVGVGSSLEVRGTGRVAVCEAPASIVCPSRHLAKGDVPVELRGAGRSSRQVQNFGTPGVLDADRIIACEVITPAGNWSSYPPHKHDETTETESRLEEVYYFEAAVERGARAPERSDPFGTFATYSSPAGEISIAGMVRTGDVALVPFGYHGPAGAAPGYDLYYLNVMAGPDPDRAWRISDDPAQAWVRRGWDHEPVDPRLPYTASANPARETTG